MIASFLFLSAIGLLIYGTFDLLGTGAACIVGGLLLCVFSLYCFGVSKEGKAAGNRRRERKQTKQERDFAKLSPKDQRALRSLGMGPLGQPSEEQIRKEQIHTGVTRPAKGAENWADDHDLPG